MITDTDRARYLAEWLNAQHHNYESWRKVAALFPPIVKAGTLNRIAKSGGAWLPKDHGILRALGLIEPKKRTEIEKRITKMAKATNDAVVRRKR